MTQRIGTNRIANSAVTIEKLANTYLDANNGGTVSANVIINANLQTSNIIVNTNIIIVDSPLIDQPANGTIQINTNTLYVTTDTRPGRAFVPVINYRFLEANATTSISTAALPFMGNSKGITLSANSAYELEWETYFLKTTAGTVTFAIRFGAAPQLVNAGYIGGIANTPGPANTGAVLSGTVDPVTLPTTPSLGNNTLQRFNIKAFIITNQTTSANCYLQALTSAGTITPRIGSYMKITELPRNETGTFT